MQSRMEEYLSQVIKGYRAKGKDVTWARNNQVVIQNKPKTNSDD